MLRTHRYKAWYLGKKSLPDDFFKHEGVAKFLSRDLLLLETFADIASLTALSMFTMVIEIYMGVSAGDAFYSMIINWFIQVFFEQINNYLIFFLREKKEDTFSLATAINDGPKICNGRIDKTEILPIVYRKTALLLQDTVWFTMLAIPYITFLIGFTLS